MRMQPDDAMGSLYSSAGFRFGGFPTAHFLKATDELETLRPGVRQEIIAEAHHLANWLHRFPEITFVVGTLVFKSFLVGLLCFFGGYLLEIARFYLWRDSPLISQISRLWKWIKFPVFLGAAFVTSDAGSSLPMIFLLFLFFQGYLGILSAVGTLPIRLPLSRLTYSFFRDKYPEIHNMEGLALQFSIERWRRQLVRGNPIK